MTAQTVYEYALALIDEISEDKTVDVKLTANYAGKAPRIIDMLQRELAKAEGIAPTHAVSALSDALDISEDTALRILPYGLAAQFALSDRDTSGYNELQSEYERKKQSVLCKEADIRDEYGNLSGLRG